MLICLRVFVEWLEIRIGWNSQNCGFSICTGSITSWIGWDDYVVTTVGSIMETTCLANIICSTWMLSITWSKLGLGSSSMLPCIVVASNSSPLPLPISYE